MQREFWVETRKIITDAIKAVEKKSLAVNAEDKDFFETKKHMRGVLDSLLEGLRQVDRVLFLPDCSVGEEASV